MKKRKRFFAIKIPSVRTVFVGFTILVFGFLLYLFYFKITLVSSIEVKYFSTDTGYLKTESNDITSRFSEYIGKPLYSINKSVLESRTENDFVWVDEVYVEKVFPNKLVFWVNEYEPDYCIMGQNGVLYIVDNFVIDNVEDGSDCPIYIADERNREYQIGSEIVDEGTKCAWDIYQKIASSGILTTAISDPVVAVFDRNQVVVVANDNQIEIDCGVDYTYALSNLETLLVLYPEYIPKTVFRLYEDRLIITERGR
ncbi:FtsQ-type POTRA domain-containing protein [Candidatus Dojkabacteria bacterium]|nr:FtsQ-type POTRA domain-containing protein [Candidatus Dojkabacteria bacterium]